MSKTIYQALVGTKGGIGKTSIAANLGGLYAGHGLRTLLIDADPQGSLSRYYPVETAASAGFLDLLTTGTAKRSQIAKTSIENLDLIRADFGPKDVAWFESHMRRDVHLKHALRNNNVTDNYDIVIIDSQGAVGAVQEAAALAADDIVSPISPHIINVLEFKSGTLALFERLAHSREPVGRIFAVINNYAQLRVSKEIIESLRKEPLDDSGFARVGLLNTMIPSMRAVVEAQALRTPLHIHDSVRQYKSPCGAEFMHALGGELVPFLRGRYARGVSPDEWPNDSPARAGLPELITHEE
jgi:chromosome partitioning related protein ParA